VSEASFHQGDAARAVDTGVLVSIIVEFDVLVCVRDDLGVDPKTLSFGADGLRGEVRQVDERGHVLADAVQ
jgi:hypothetical protein